MNRNFGWLVRATLISLAGLWTLAVPAEASTIPNWGFGETALISPSGLPGFSNASASYTSYYNPAGGYFGFPAGINSSLTDPTSSLTYSPAGAASGGLTGAGIDLSEHSSAVDVSGSLASGATHIYASTINATVGGIYTEAFASVEIQDLLQFAVGGTGSDTITFGLSLDGSVASAYGLDYSMLVQENFGTAFEYWDAGSAAPPNTSPTSGWNTALFTNNSETGFNFTGTMTVTNGETVPILFLEQLECVDGTVCDFSNTTQMSLILPSDVTYTSASGVFLTQTAATPEPSSLMLFGSGIAAVLCARRRRMAR
jgi:hypothetical protein